MKNIDTENLYNKDGDKVKNLILLLILLLILTGCQKNVNVNNDVTDKLIISKSESKDLKEVSSNTYTFKHGRDNSTYAVVVKKSSDSNYTMLVYDSESEQLQSIPMVNDIFVGIDFQDVNLDGYTDIVINTGGTLNETHDLYVWDISSLSYVKVVFDGFEMLSFFEVYDGYIKNFIRGNSPEDSVMEKLIWNENTLVKDSNYE